MTIFAFLCEKDPKDLFIAIGPNLIDVTPQVTCGHKTILPDVLHCTHDCCDVNVVETVEELLNGTPTHLGSIVTPPPLDSSSRLLA
jgi:hypothetical protein